MSICADGMAMSTLAWREKNAEMREDMAAGIICYTWVDVVLTLFWRTSPDPDRATVISEFFSISFSLRTLATSHPFSPLYSALPVSEHITDNVGLVGITCKCVEIGNALNKCNSGISNSVKETLYYVDTQCIKRLPAKQTV